MSGTQIWIGRKPCWRRRWRCARTLLRVDLERLRVPMTASFSVTCDRLARVGEKIGDYTVRKPALREARWECRLLASYSQTTLLARARPKHDLPETILGPSLQPDAGDSRLLAVLTSWFGAHLSKPVIPNPRAFLRGEGSAFRFLLGACRRCQQSSASCLRATAPRSFLAFLE